MTTETPFSPGTWLVPVRLNVAVRVGLRMRKPGSVVELPFSRALAMHKDGRADLLLPTINTTSGRMHDPAAPRATSAPYTFGGKKW